MFLKGIYSFIVFFLILTLKNEIVSISATETVDQFLNLLNLISNKVNTTEIRDYIKKRQNEIPFQLSEEMDEISAYLSLYKIRENIDSMNEISRNVAKQMVIRKVTELTRKMCKVANITGKDIDSDIAKIKLQQIDDYKLWTKNFSFPQFYDSDEADFYLNLPNKQNKTKYCFVLTWYPEDYLAGNINDTIYGIRTYELENFNEIYNNKENTSIFTISLQIQKPIDQTCLMWSGTKWSENECERAERRNDTILCKCYRFGYLKLGKSSDPSDINEELNLPTIESNLNISTVVSNNSVPDFNVATENSNMVLKTGTEANLITILESSSNTTVTEQDSSNNFANSGELNNDSISSSTINPHFIVDIGLPILPAESPYINPKYIPVLHYAIPIGCFLLICIAFGTIFLYDRYRKRNSSQEIEILSVGNPVSPYEILENDHAPDRQDRI